MKKFSIARLLVIAGASLGATSAAHAQTTATWLTDTTGNWNNSTKWSTNPEFPNNIGANLFNAVIAISGNPYDVNLNTPITIENFTLSSATATVNFQGGNTLTVNQALSFTGGMITGTAANGALRIRGAATLDGATFNGMGEVFFDGGVNCSGTGDEDINDTCVIHRGIGSWSGTGNINFGGTSGIEILAGSTFTISSNANMTWDNTGSMAAYVNQGTTIKTSSGTTNITDVTVNNTGTLDVRTGTLSTNGVMLTGGLLSAGIWKVSAGGNMDLIGTTITANSAEVSVDGATSTFGALSALTTNNAAGKLTFSGGKTFTTTGNFTNSGRVTVGTGSTFTVAPGSSLTNYNTGTQTLTGGTFDVSGILKFDNTGISAIDGALTLNGVAAEVQTGAGANALAGASKITTNGKLALKGNKTFTTTVNFKVEGANSGVLEIEAGSEFQVPAGLSLDNYDLGLKTLSEGDFQVAGMLTFPNSGVEILDSKLTLDGPTAMIVDSTTMNDALTDLKMVDANGAITLANNADLTANPDDNAGFVFTVAPTGRVSVNEGSNLDINGDIVNYSAGELTNGIFNVQGTLRARNITNITTIRTTIGLDSPTSNITNFNNDNVFETVNLITATGNFRVSNGRQLNLTDAAGVVNNGIFTVGRTVATDIPDTALVVVSNNYTQNAGSGTVLQNGGELLVIGQYNMNGGSLNVARAQVHVIGNFQHNTGLVSLHAASVLLVDGASGYTQTGGELLLDGGTLNAAGGYNHIGGTLSGDGTINGDTVSGGIITPGRPPFFAPGDMSGRIMVTGSLTIGSAAAMVIDLNFANSGGLGGSDEVTVLGALMFEQGRAGRLEIAYTTRPQDGDVFTPLKYGSRFGTFLVIEGLHIDNTMFLLPAWGPNGLTLTAVEVPGAASIAPLFAAGLLAGRRRRN